MLPLRIENGGNRPKYEQLYRQIREAVTAGRLADGERLPSKRRLAEHLNLAVNTVENAYAQLIAEGYIETREKRGYYVQRIEAPLRAPRRAPPAERKPAAAAPAARFDLKTNVVDVRGFPFATWAKLMRECLRGNPASLLDEPHPQGDPDLRREIARYLAEFRGMTLSPDRIIVGSGTAHLVGILHDLLPRHRFAVETPCYPAMPRMLRHRGATVDWIPLDGEGMRVDLLPDADAALASVTPSHHFPLGTVMGARRRTRLLRWAAEGKARYILEDDYDSEFRFMLQPVPTLHSLDANDRVVFINTFSRTISPSLRIAYMALPHRLADAYARRGMVQPCPVSVFEQRTLHKFLEGGYYERHLARMRKLYKKRRDTFLRCLAPLDGRVAIAGGEAGLHLLLRAENGMTEGEMIRRAAAKGVAVYGLSGYYMERRRETRTVIVGYGRLEPDDLARAAALLCLAWK